MSETLKPPPAPFDAGQLADTLDTMGLLVVSLSDRIDAQGRMLEQVLKTATEARAAAFAAEKATDWERNGDFIEEGIARQSRYIDELVKAMGGQIDVMNLVFEEVIPFLRIVGPRELKRRARFLWWWMPLMLAGAFGLGVGLTLIAVRVG